MSQSLEDDAEYMTDEYEVEDTDDNKDDEFRSRHTGGSDSELDEYDHMNHKLADTSAAQARRGKDIQGIPWERLSITREKYRQTRLEQYKNCENIPQSGEGLETQCKITNKGGFFYEFRCNSRSVKPTILHFQLRNLVWATSKHDVYFMSHFSVLHWSSLTSNKSEVLNVSGHVAPHEKHPGSLLEGFTQTQVSTLAVKDNLLVVGGFQGELICKYLDRPGVCYCSRTTYDDNAVTNAVDIYTTPSGAVHFTASNNDCGVRDFDMEKFQMSKHFRFPWPVNHTSMSPDGRLLIIVGDNPEGMLVDSSSGKTVAPLRGHVDFSFASAWHPDDYTFATGNQDKTCRVWDVRNLSKSVTVLKGNLGAIRSIRYSSDGQFMAMAESADFVHVFDVKSGYKKEQEIDFFGEISGTSFSPDTETLFIGVGDRTYGSLLEYGRALEATPVNAFDGKKWRDFSWAAAPDLSVEQSLEGEERQAEGEDEQALDQDVNEEDVAPRSHGNSLNLNEESEESLRAAATTLHQEVHSQAIPTASEPPRTEPFIADDIFVPKKVVHPAASKGSSSSIQEGNGSGSSSESSKEKEPSPMSQVSSDPSFESEFSEMIRRLEAEVSELRKGHEIMKMIMRLEAEVSELRKGQEIMNLKLDAVLTGLSDQRTFWKHEQKKEQMEAVVYTTLAPEVTVTFPEFTTATSVLMKTTAEEALET